MFMQSVLPDSGPSKFKQLILSSHTHVGGSGGKTKEEKL